MMEPPHFGVWHDADYQDLEGHAFARLPQRPPSLPDVEAELIRAIDIAYQDDETRPRRLAPYPARPSPPASPVRTRKPRVAPQPRPGADPLVGEIRRAHYKNHPRACETYLVQCVAVGSQEQQGCPWVKWRGASDNAPRHGYWSAERWRSYPLIEVDR